MMRIFPWLLCFLCASHLVCAQPEDGLPGTNPLEWTVEEQEWIAAHPVVRIAVDRHLVPFDYVGEDGAHLGIASSYLELVAEATGLRFEIVADAPWNQLLDSVENGEADAVACIVPTPDREERFLFSTPYASFPAVIITRDERPEFINGIKGLIGQKVAVEQGFYTEEILRREWPQLELRTYPSRLAALQSVAGGENFAYVGNLAGTTYLIRRENLANLQVASPTRMGRTELSVGIARRHPELLSIVNKVLAQVDDPTRNQIEQQWVAVRYAYVSLERLGRWVGLLALVAGLVLLWNFLLSRQIRKRRKIEQALSEREAMLTRLGDNVPNGAFFRLALRADGSTCFLFVTKVFERFFARPTEELLTACRGFIDIIDPEAKDAYLEARNHSAATLTPFTAEISVTNDQGHRMWLEISATPVRESDGTIIWDGVAIDVTERSEAARRIEQNETRLRLAIEGAALGVWEYTAEGERYTINARQALLHGISPEHLNPPMAEGMRHVIEEDRRALLRSTCRLINGESTEELCEYRVKLENGDIRWIQSHGRVLERDRNGAALRAVGISRDVTARKQFEASLRRAKDIAEQMNHQKSEFLGMAAHDLKNPLSAIVGMTSLLREQLTADGSLSRDDPAVCEMLDSVVEASDHMLNLIHDLLDVERIESGQSLDLKEVDVSLILENAVELSRAQARAKQIGIQVERPNHCRTTVDRDRMLEVFDNLINNAVKYSPAHTQVQVCLKPGTTAGSFRFEVKDAGPGLRSEDFENLFQRFKKLSARPTAGESSSGLGLSIVKTIVERHGGKVFAQNHPAGGAAFIVEIPGLPSTD